MGCSNSQEGQDAKPMTNKKDKECNDKVEAIMTDFMSDLEKNWDGKLSYEESKDFLKGKW